MKEEIIPIELSKSNTSSYIIEYSNNTSQILYYIEKLIDNQSSIDNKLLLSKVKKLQNDNKDIINNLINNNPK